MNEIIKSNVEVDIINTCKKFLESSGIGKNLTDNEKETFLQMAKIHNLNPFKREIYAIVYGTGANRVCNFVTGYEVYLKKAPANLLNGWSCKEIFDAKGVLIGAKITIYRKDWAQPFEHSVLLREYNQNNKIWQSKPATMIKKVCIAQAFRLCFSQEFDGMLYTADEMNGDSDEIPKIKDVTEPQAEKPLIKPDVSKEKEPEYFKEVYQLATKLWEHLPDKAKKYIDSIDYTQYTKEMYDVDMKNLENIMKKMAKDRELEENETEKKKMRSKGK